MSARIPRPARRLGLALVTALLAGIAALTSCFSLREPPCAFSCLAPPHRCPAQYTCESDGLCHRGGATGMCALTPPGDGGDDAAANDAVGELADAPDAGGSERFFP